MGDPNLNSAFLASLLISVRQVKLRRNNGDVIFDEADPTPRAFINLSQVKY